VVNYSNGFLKDQGDWGALGQTINTSSTDETDQFFLITGLCKQLWNIILMETTKKKEQYCIQKSHTVTFSSI